MGDECKTCGAPIAYVDYPDDPVVYDSNMEFMRGWRAGTAEVGRLQSLIVEFAKGMAWADDAWKRQKHIAPLFEEAERIASEVSNG